MKMVEFLICLGILCVVTVPILALGDGWRGAVIGFVLMKKLKKAE